MAGGLGTRTFLSSSKIFNCNLRIISSISFLETVLDGGGGIMLAGRIMFFLAGGNGGRSFF